MRSIFDRRIGVYFTENYFVPCVFISIDQYLSHPAWRGVWPDPGLFIRINAKGEGGERVEEFARRIGFKDAEEMADAVLELKKKMGLRCDLKDLELDDDQIAELVRISRHPNLYNNPVEITDEMLDEMYRYLARK